MEIVGGVSKKTCDKCKAWVGRIVSITGKTPEYPTLADAKAAGLFHPRCTHNISAAMTFEGEIAKAKYIAESERKASATIEEGKSFWHAMDGFEQASAREYTDWNTCFMMNDHLWNGAPASKEILKSIEWLDQALQRASLPEDMVLYRGVTPGIWEAMKSDPKYITPGKTFPTKGFTSTTYDRTTAWKHASGKAKDADEIAMIEVLAPKGTQALSLEANSYSPQDKEVLINKGTKFKVVEARKDGNVMRLIWEVVL